MIATQWDEAAAWINLKWDRQPLDPVVAKAWFESVEPYAYDDVLKAINRLVIERPIRPSVAELVAMTRAVVAGKSTPALPVHIPNTKAYGKAWQAIGTAVREHRLPKAELDTLAEKHRLFFARLGEESKATAEMVAEVQALAARANAVPETGAAAGSSPKFQSRYSDTHKAQYMANVAAKEEAEKAGKAQ